MVRSPQRIGTPYRSAGYEITAAGYANVAAALKGWQSSIGHNDVILNKALWADLNWNAIGIGVLNGSESVGGSLRGNIYHVWFGEDVDPAAPPLIMGTRGADRIRGTRFDDEINGGGGNDILKGGPGADRFRFDSALNSNTNVDRITDFKRAQGDRFELARSVFKRLPAGRTLAASAFGVGSSFTSRAERILYDPAIGSLTYDSNGSAAGGRSAVFAILGNLPTIDHSVFTLI